MTKAKWLRDALSTSEGRRAYERERLIVWTSEALLELMDACGRSKADVARVLETSRAHITQVMSGTRNMTLNTLADIAWACDARAEVTFEPLLGQEFIEAPVQMVRTAKPQIVSQESMHEDPVAEPAEPEPLAA